MKTLSCLGLLLVLVFLLPYVLFKLFWAYLQQRNAAFRQQQQQKQQATQTHHNTSPRQKGKIFQKNNSEYVDFEDLRDTKR